MTAFLAGIAPTRCEEHPKADQIDAIARGVLSAMAWFASEDDPRCYASQSRVASKAGCHRTVAHKAMKRLADLELIERVEGKPGVPVHWRLVILAASEPVAESDRSTPGNLSRSATGPVAESDTPCSGERHNPSDLSGAPAEEREEDRDAADAAASAGAPAAAAAPSTEPRRGIVAEVMAARGCTLEAAERWIERKVGASTTPVRNEVRYIRTCLEQEAADAASSAKGHRPPAGSAKKGGAPAGKGGKRPKGIPSPGQKAPALSRRRSHVPDDEVSAAVAASRSGEAYEQIAERLNVRAERVRSWRQVADRRDAWAAVRSGEDPGQVAARFGMDAGELAAQLDSHRRRTVRDSAIAELRKGMPDERVAATASAKLGEPVAARDVRAWLAEHVEMQRRRQALGLSA